MKKTFLFLTLISLLSVTACKKNDTGSNSASGLPRTSVPADLQGNWIYGNFSMTEYWSQDPAGYIGNALEFAIAFTFDADGNCEQYFTSGSSTGGVTTYQQSVTKGTVEVDPTGKTIKTHPFKAHYKRTRNGQTVEERDMTGNELTSATTYTYTIGVEPSGKKAIYLTLAGTPAPLTFVKR